MQMTFLRLAVSVDDPVLPVGLGLALAEAVCAGDVRGGPAHQVVVAVYELKVDLVVVGGGRGHGVGHCHEGESEDGEGVHGALLLVYSKLEEVD